jgi:hypothetical protein
VLLTFIDARGSPLAGDHEVAAGPVASARRSRHHDLRMKTSIGRPGDRTAEDRCAQGEQDEEPAAFSHVLARNRVVDRPRAAEPGDGKAGQDTQELDDHGDDPQSQLRFVMYKSAGKPQRLLADPQTNALWNTPASGCPPSTPTARTVRMIWIAASPRREARFARTPAAASQTSPSSPASRPQG